MTDFKKVKGKFLFIPEDEETAYEIDMASLLDSAQTSLFTRIKNFILRKKEQDISLSLKEIDSETVSVNDIICDKLTELLSSAQWIYKPYPDETTPFYVFSVSAKEYPDGWEPQVVLTTPNGSALQMGFTDLLVNFQPHTETIDKKPADPMTN